MTGFFHCTSGRSMTTDCFKAVVTMSDENRSRRRARLMAGVGAGAVAIVIGPELLKFEGRSADGRRRCPERLESAAEGDWPQVLGDRPERSDRKEQKRADHCDRSEQQEAE